MRLKDSTKKAILEDVSGLDLANKRPSQTRIEAVDIQNTQTKFGK